jgi:Flp pilus assembly protein TadG
MSPAMRSRWPRPTRRGQAGVATVEAVLVVPLVLIPVLVAVVVFGQLVHVRTVLDAAAAAGARQAAVAGADGPTVRGRIATELLDGGVSPASVSITVEPAVAAWGQPIRVRLATTGRAAIPFLGSWSVPLASEFVTRSEVTH